MFVSSFGTEYPELVNEYFSDFEKIKKSWKSNSIKNDSILW